MNSEETGLEHTFAGLEGQGDAEDDKRYRLAMEAAELGTWDFFPLSGKMVWNHQCRSLFGVSPHEPVDYTVFLDHIYIDDRDRVDRCLHEVRTASGNHTIDCEFRTTVYHNEQPKWIRLKGKVIFNESLQATRFICVVMEVSDKHAESLKKLTLELERTNQHLEEFAFMTSHDLQEPLRKIRIFTQLLQEKLSPVIHENARLYLDKINASAIRMGALIRCLLDYSRLSGNTALFIQTDLNEMLHIVMTDLEINISRVNATIHVDPLPVIEAIPVQIVQLFTNLVNNALKFSCENVPPVINIEARDLSPQEVAKYPSLNPRLKYTQITVRDNGIGFDPAFSEQIFGLFQRLHGQNQYEGTGIGLSICRKIATNHNGHIFADSKKDMGTRFHVILPYRQK
jgi:Bacteriophytochrome (light-regulated signal transduction histidine kinase)